MLDGVSLGDTWKHPAIKRADATNGLMPFHKLSQWLTYSLIEPLQQAGYRSAMSNGLTGLAEYRNGGLFVDAGVIALRDPANAMQDNAVGFSACGGMARAHGRAARQDRAAGARRARRRRSDISARLRARRRHLGGRAACSRNEKRADAGPPIRVISDGTVF